MTLKKSNDGKGKGLSSTPKAETKPDQADDATSPELSDSSTVPSDTPAAKFYVVLFGMEEEFHLLDEDDDTPAFFESYPEAQLAAENHTGRDKHVRGYKITGDDPTNVIYSVIR